ncbi:hypothetical protein [Vibrio parahaemolyticus]|uniref:hypothetical protein n=1 Tax=Vibrio parahaemolyticus TaxID=670 RepID=UPI00112295BA|nr:hypothetical protein [Vibrio parahaemolyticus]TOA32036.1 hypothetical protein CGK30_16980 [Vibrio parahaemolyticus]HCH1020192.1 hypothetical protein [Vibrio parahaemolyticus]
MTINNKFSCRAYLGSQKVKAKDHRVLFDVNTPARCTIKVEGSPMVNTIVAVDIGWGDSISRVFLGYVERVQPAEKGWSELFCRELAALLFEPLNVTLRHPTLMQLLSDVTNKTGLQFVVPEAAYSKTSIPCFYSDGNGYRVMDELSQAFGIEDLFWQQQGNGQIYVGSWKDSYWADKPVTIPDNLMTNRTASKSVKVPAIPKLRPGAIVNGLRLVGVDFQGTEVKLTWT